MFSRLKKQVTARVSSEDQNSTIPRLTIYDDAMSMLAGSLIIYFFADLRDMARNGEISASIEELSPPLTSVQVLGILQGNEEALAKRAIDSDDLRRRLEAFHSLKEQESGGMFDQLFQRASSSMSVSSSSSFIKSKTIMTHFVDTKAQEEIVHAIVANEKHKRITVIFRGSVTNKDFMQDAKIAQKTIPNPVASMIEVDDHKTDAIKIHTGFFEYLFCENKETGESRLQQILAQVKASLEQYPGYSIYCCGHSLGAALATLFGFFVAADSDLHSLMSGRPVVVYSIASPYVGNWKFRFAFQHLERTKRIQHLRIANLEDMVTLMPFATPKLTALSPALSLLKGAGNLYTHCGMRLLLTSADQSEEGSIHTLSYPKGHEANDEEYAEEIKDALKAGKSLSSAFYSMIWNDVEKIAAFHSCEEYEQRMNKCRSDLSSVTLDELYADKSIVGDILDADYNPRKPESGWKRASKAFGHMTRKSSSEKP